MQVCIRLLVGDLIHMRILGMKFDSISQVAWSFFGIPTSQIRFNKILHFYPNFIYIQETVQLNSDYMHFAQALSLLLSQADTILGLDLKLIWIRTHQSWGEYSENADWASILAWARILSKFSIKKAWDPQYEHKLHCNSTASSHLFLTQTVPK